MMNVVVRSDFLRAQLDQMLQQEIGQLDAPSRLRTAISHSLLAPAKRVRGLIVLLTLESYGFMWQRG
ncbi:MAG: hypothetical protein FWE76_08505, partial [Symbiobacteriaceae bacterium]|nr:hypothetical protein [Symbiobacteriaceae bacterium]